MKALPAYLILLAAIWYGALRLDASLNKRAPVVVGGPGQYSTIFRGQALRVLALGYDNALADYQFMKLIQYFANQSDRNLPLNNVYNMADAITDLDPKFTYGYQFAWNLLTNFEKVRPTEVWVKEGGDILRKGWRNNSDSWQIAQDLAFHNFYYEGNFEQAANMYDEAFRLRPSFQLYPNLAAKLRTIGGRPEAALKALEQQFNVAVDPIIRKSLQNQYNLVYAESNARILDEMVERYHKEKGRLPDKLEDLIAAGKLRRIPADGMGGTYIWNSEKQEVESTTSGRMQIYYDNAYIPPWKKKAEEKTK